VLNLTTPDFRDYVLRCDETTIWLVLFVGMNRKVCFKAIREFKKSAITAQKLAHFAVVNISEEPFLAQRAQIEYVPKLKIYHPGRVDDFTGKFTAAEFIDSIGSKMPNFVRTFDRKWLDESLPSVVLFTDQIRVPTIWASLSLQFRDHFLRFGICSAFHLHREMGIARLPTVYFYNGSSAIRFRGDMTETDLTAAISAFVNGSLTSDDSVDDEGFYRLNEFEEHCRGRDFCVLHIGVDLPVEYRRIRLLCRRHPMKFFYGEGPTPLLGLVAGNYYIWNPRRKGIIEIGQVEELAPAIDRVVDGGAKRTAAKEVQAEQEEEETPDDNL
jgi:hypothetical protein